MSSVLSVPSVLAIPSVPAVPSAEMPVFDTILELLATPVASAYNPVVRDDYKTTSEDVALIEFYAALSAIPSAPQRAEWQEKTRDLSMTHAERLETRGLWLKLAGAHKGTPAWNYIVYGPSKEDYDEMDRAGLENWREQYTAAGEEAQALVSGFLALSLDELVTCARWYRNAGAWAVFRAEFSEPEFAVIENEIDRLDHLDDEQDRLEHLWDD